MSLSLKSSGNANSNNMIPFPPMSAIFFKCKSIGENMEIAPVGHGWEAGGGSRHSGGQIDIKSANEKCPNFQKFYIVTSAPETPLTQVAREASPKMFRNALLETTKRETA